MEKNNNSRIKIAVIGPESSGKSKLCEELSRHFLSDWVPEFARTYLEKNPIYQQKDLRYFLKEQIKSEQQFQSSLLFCDTDPVSIKVWSLYKFDSADPYFHKKITTHPYTHRLLLSPNLPYQSDPLRENESLEERREIFDLFKEQLGYYQLHYSVIDGLEEKRIKKAVTVVSKLI